ncbi:hypothetical protein [Streptomyces sp. C184]|uniref:hypothetical protein n=1 Tax=Streptomyces sp. C184 TaxID=3237121 RepID=UPI0034C63039
MSGGCGCCRLGAAPLQRLFETLAGPSRTASRPAHSTPGFAPWPSTAPCCTHPKTRLRYAKRAGEKLEFGYLLLRLVVLVTRGTHAILAAAF